MFENSISERIPGAAAQTAATAFTARFAVWAGVVAAIRSRGTGNFMSMSSGASPSTVIRLEAGLLADVIAVPGDPLADIGVTEDVRFGMKGGRVWRPDEGAA